MRILIYNDKLDDLGYLYEIMEVVSLELVIDKTFDYEDFFELYNKYNYDTVCIEYFDDVWDKIIRKINVLNSEQRIILLSDKYSCSQVNNCANCQENSNINVIIKPILNNEVMNLFSKVFRCEEYDKNELEFNIFKINKKINSKYGSIHVDISAHFFTFNIISEYNKVAILSDLILELKTMNIEYSITENMNIKVLS